MIYRYVIFCIIFSIFFLEFEFPIKKLDQSDEITEYLFRKIDSTEGEFKESCLFRLAELYIKMGWINNALRIFKMLSEEYYKYSIIFSLLNENNKLSYEDLKNITELDKEIKDETYKVDIFFEKLLYYLKVKDQKNSLIFLKKFKKIENKTKYENYYLLVGLMKGLYKNKLAKEAETILKDLEEYEDFPRRDLSFLLSEILKNSYNLLGKNKIKQLISKSESLALTLKKSEEIVKTTIKIYLTLLSIHHYVKAQDYMEKIVSACTKFSNREKRLDCLKAFLADTYNIHIFSCLNQIKDFEKTLIENIDFSFDDSSDEAYNRYVIKFLIEKGKFKKAEEITLRLDKHERTLQLPESSLLYWDYFYYFMGKEYLKVSETRENSLDFEKKIKNNSNLKIKLLLEFAKTINTIENEEKFLKIITQAYQIVQGEIKDKIERYNWLKKILKLCLINGFSKKTLVILYKLDESLAKSILQNEIDEISYIAIKKNDLDLSKKLLNKFHLNQVTKSYIMSKMAAKLMINRKEKEAKLMFKKAIDTFFTSDCGDLDFILNDYYFSKYEGRIVKTKILEKIIVLEL